MKLTIGQLAERLGAELRGNSSDKLHQIKAIGPVETASENEITFISDSRHIKALKKSEAGAVIVADYIEGSAKPQLVVKNVNAALIEVLNIFAPKLKNATVGIDESAKIADNAKIGEGVSVGAGVVIEDDAEIGANSVIGSGCRIGENSKIGQGSRLDSNVVVYHNCKIGNSVIIQANSTIGAVGFGYACIDGIHKLIPHNGAVIIEDCVEIGANTCVDRAKFGNTIIGAGTKIDNLVQVAHNVIIGKCCLIAGQVALGGSCIIGDGVVIGGQSGVRDNIELGDRVAVGSKSAAMRSVPAGQQVYGAPAIDANKMLKIVSLTRRLPELFEQLKQLTIKVKKLEAAEDNKG